jgi:hypothetical protein
MITISDYFGAKIDDPDATPERVANAEELLRRVNALLDYAALEGVYEDWIDEDTGTQISGAKGGYGDGGFRLQSSKTGAPKSSHKMGQGVDVFDPHGKLDNWITDQILEEFDLYREHPAATRGWCHLQTRKLSVRTFWP